MVCFAHPDNKDLAGIVKALRTGKMLVDWLDEWRKYTIEDNNYQSLTGLIPRSLLRFTEMPSEARPRLIPRSLLRGSLFVMVVL